MFPRISRKTNKEKTGFTAYRIVGIANQEGNLDYFIATKSISQHIDSHKRDKMKCFFGPTGETHLSEEGWLFEAQGIKNKYFNIGEKRVFIKKEIMQKINQGIYI